MNNQIQQADNPYAAPQTPLLNEYSEQPISLGWWLMVHLGLAIASIIFFPVALVAALIAIFVTDNKSKKNFFIAYLLKFVVVLILLIPILAAIALPAYQDYTKRAKTSQTISEVSGIKSEIAEAYLKGEPFTQIDTEPFKSNNIKDIEIQENGTVVITVSEKIDPQMRSFTLTPQFNEHNMQWQCSSNGLPLKYLPQECRQ
ncbi:MAG: pilin [Neisseriaceae bacterium]|nr:pilin [Neisseriaceae bacterium]